MEAWCKSSQPTLCWQLCRTRDVDGSIPKEEDEAMGKLGNLRVTGSVEGLPEDEKSRQL